MIEKIAYIVKNNGAVICRCFGSGAYAEIPSEVDGLPVLELADHCFAPEPSARIPKHQLLYAVREGEKFTAQNRTARAAGAEVPLGTAQAGGAEYCEPLCGDRLKEIYLPDGLRAVGDYSFYNCMQLARIRFPASITRMGGGAFVACNHLQTVVFQTKAHSGAGMETEDETFSSGCLKEVITDISYEIEAELTDREGNLLCALLFPEYYEDSQENTPARIIEIKYEGTGYKYRQSFREKEINLNQYDSLFYLASVQELPSTVLHLALLRLRTPVRMKEQAREEYMAYLKCHADETAEYVLDEENMDLLPVLCDTGFFTADILERFIIKAGEHEKAAAVSLLLDYRRKHFPVKRKKYEF